VAEAPALKPVRVYVDPLDEQHPTGAAMRHLRAAYADLLRQPLPSRLTELIENFSAP